MSRKNRWIALGIALVAALLLLRATLPAAITNPQSRKPAPDFTVNDSHGAPLHLSQYRGKVVLLNFWATWCHGCKEEIPWFMEYADKYKKDGLVIIGVAMDDEGWTLVKPYVEDKKMNYPVVVGNEEIAKLYGGIEEMPATFLIDRRGNIASTTAGMVDKTTCETDIRALLQEPR